MFGQFFFNYQCYKCSNLCVIEKFVKWDNDKIYFNQELLCINCHSVRYSNEFEIKGIFRFKCDCGKWTEIPTSPTNYVVDEDDKIYYKVPDLICENHE